MIGGPWTRLYTLPIKRGDKKIFLACSDGIWERKKLSDERPFIRNSFDREARKIF